jgi:hypothetical protein
VRRLNRNDPCPCGSEETFRRCCGSTVWIFDHPDLKLLKDIRATDQDAARAAFEFWWNTEITAGRMGARRPFSDGRVYKETDQKASNYVAIERRGEGFVCAGPCRDFTFRYVFKGAKKEQAYCVPCFLKAAGAPEGLVKDPERVRGFTYDQGGQLVLDMVDEEAPGQEVPFEPPKEWTPEVDQE